MRLRHKESVITILSSTIAIVSSAVHSVSSAVVSTSVLLGSLVARRWIDTAKEADLGAGRDSVTDEKPVAEIYRQEAVGDVDAHIRSLAKARKPYANVSVDMID